jgi:hypothetical protein
MRVIISVGADESIVNQPEARLADRLIRDFAQRRRLTLTQFAGLRKLRIV